MKMDMDKVWDESQNCPDQNIYYRVMSSWLLKTPIFDLVISITPSVSLNEVETWWNVRLCQQCMLF